MTETDVVIDHKPVATLTIDAKHTLSDEGCDAVVTWLRDQAEKLIESRAEYSSPYTAVLYG